MEQAEFEGRYERLKDKLAMAYASPASNSPHIDRLARELLAIELIASSRREEEPLCSFETRAMAGVLAKRAAPHSSWTTTRSARVATSPCE